MADEQSENSELRHRKVEERDSNEPMSAKENVSTTAENSEGVSVKFVFYLL